MKVFWIVFHHGRVLFSELSVLMVPWSCVTIALSLFFFQFFSWQNKQALSSVDRHFIRKLATQSTAHSSLLEPSVFLCWWLFKLSCLLSYKLLSVAYVSFPDCTFFWKAYLVWLSFSSHGSICGKARGSQHVQKLIKTFFTTECLHIISFS